MSRPNDSREAVRKDALTAFLDARVTEGYRVETRTDTHAIIVPPRSARGLLDRLRGAKRPERQVVAVDEHGVVTMSPAEPLRF